MSLLRAFLQVDGTLDELREKFAISHTRHKKYPNLVLLKYSQIESPFAEPLVREARGIILDEVDNWRVVCKRFDKFFNAGEVHAAKIDWSTARVQEKVDGSLMTLYFYNGHWEVASSGMPDASGDCQGWDFTFAQLFWRTFDEMGLKLPDNTNLCVSFEMTTPFNRVVVPHKTSSLTLIGIHDLEYGGREVRVDLPLHPSYCPEYPVVKSYPLATLDEVLDAANKIDGLHNEGFIVVDQDFNRIKVKSPKYLMLHHLKDGWSMRRVVEIVLAGETAEIVAYFPEYAEQFDIVQGRYDAVIANLETTYADIKHLTDKKEFALALQARKPPGHHALYMLHAGKVGSVKEYLSQHLHLDSLIDTLGLKTEKERP